MSEPITVPDTIPDELLEQPPQDEITPQGDTIRPSPPKPSWQDKVFSRAKKEPRAKKPAPPKGRRGGLVKPLTEIYTTVGTMMMPFDQHCGTIIITQAEECAKALDALAQENDAVRRVLMQLVQTSVWGALVAAHLPILLGVAMHHVGSLKDAPIAAMVIRPDQNGHGPYGQ